jgi:hypothetical protein
LLENNANVAESTTFVCCCKRASWLSNSSRKSSNFILLSQVPREYEVINGLKEGFKPPMRKEIKSALSIGLPTMANWSAKLLASWRYSAQVLVSWRIV